MTIIDGLVAEHRVFLTFFDEIERALPDVKTVHEIALLCRLLETPISNHGRAEQDLAYITLDHVLQQQDSLNRLHHDHRELDGLLHEVAAIDDLREARLRMKAALDACRAHFDDEERNVFPLMEKALHHETLLALGRAWITCAHLSQPAAVPRPTTKPDHRKRL